jgi:hypothetical protein
MQESAKQHEQIIEGFKTSNVSLVESLVRDNAEKGRDMLVEEILKEKSKHGPDK